MTAPTVPVIVHRADEYGTAGEVFGQMSSDAVTTHSSLLAVLTTYAGMAGGDSVGAQWASGYDEAAQLAVSTSSKLATSCGQTRDLIAVGAHNHQVAETAADRRNLPSPPVPALSIDPCLAETVPSAAGNGIPEPFGWSLIEDAVGLAWPNGHQDQLNAAKTAWVTAAGDYRAMAGQVPRAVELLSNQQSPEIGISVATCQTRQADLTALADACQALGDVCGEYAHQLDEAHHRILDELEAFVIETVAAEAAFAALAPVTATVSEWVGNTALAGRIAMRGRRVATVISELAASVGKMVAEVVRPLIERLKPLLERVRRWVTAAKGKLTPLGRRGVAFSNGQLFSRMGKLMNKEVLESGEHLPMNQETIEEYARLAGVDLQGVKVDIASTPDDIRFYDSMRASASTANSGHINLAPAAFVDEESLLRNLVHERVHIEQFQQGRVSSGVTDQLEEEAYRADEEFWSRYLTEKEGR